jgi:hypothetical protein
MSETHKLPQTVLEGVFLVWRYYSLGIGLDLSLVKWFRGPYH